MRIAVGFCFLCLLLATTPRGGDATPLREKFVIFPSETSARAGEKLTLTCLRDGPVQEAADPPPSYEWVKNGKVILGQREKILMFKELSVQDDGIYQCGPPDINVFKKHFHLSVMRGSGATNRSRRALGRSSGNLVTETFYVDEYGSPLEGRPLRLRCYHFGPPSTDHTATFVWFKDGAMIEGKTEQDINFESLTRKDEGVYECQIKDSDVPRKRYHLPVPSTLPRPTAFMDRFPVCGQRFSLECIIMEGYKWHENLVYTWYKGSTKIEGQSERVMWFDNVTKADTGKYTCTVRDGPESTTSAHSPPFDLNPYVVPEVHIKPTTPDSVVKGILGGSLTLTCQVSYAYPSVPSRGYSWSFLPSSQGPSQALPSRTKTLNLSNLGKEHSGQYTCQARSDQDFPSVTMVGKASVTVDIVYLENMYLTPAMEVEEGDWVTLTCRVDSHPYAHLTWSMNGAKIRQVVDNLDHFVIPAVTCADSMNYTCLASNTDMPGRDVEATTQLLVLCSNEHQNEEKQTESTQADVLVPFFFTLPKQTPLVLVHPSDRDIMTVYQNCSIDIHPSFLSRCLHPHCDLARRLFSFTLSKVTDNDEGVYICMEVGQQRKAIANCKQTLILPRLTSDLEQRNYYTWFIICLALISMLVASAVIFLILFRFRLGQLILKIFWLLISTAPTPSTEGTGYSFENLYEKGKLYIFPKLATLENENRHENDKEQIELATFLSPDIHDLTNPKDETEAKHHIRYAVQKTVKRKDMPCFILHNISLGLDKTFVLILSRKLGIVLLALKSTRNKKSPTFEEVVKCLSEATKRVEKILDGFVKRESITTVIALTDQSRSDLQHIREQYEPLRNNPHVKLLLVQDHDDSKKLFASLMSRPDSGVWDLGNPEVDCVDTAFKIAASRFLTLGMGCHPGEPSERRSEAETWLLTPEQVEIRDSTATLLHIWGTLGEGKKTLLIHRAEQWLRKEKAVVLVVGKDMYDAMLARLTEVMLKDQSEDGENKIRVCCSNKALNAALKELKDLHPNVEVCIITDILHHPGMFQVVLNTVQSKQVSAVWSSHTDNLHTINGVLSKKASQLGWERIHLPSRICRPNSTVHLMSLLGRRGLSNVNDPTSSNAKPAGDKPRWKVVDHCLHQVTSASSTSACTQCREEVSTDRQPLEQSRWTNWIAIHSGQLHDVGDVQRLQATLQALDVPFSTSNHSNTFPISGFQLAPTETQANRDCSVDGKEKLADDQVRLEDQAISEADGILLVHWDNRDNDTEQQSQDNKKLRLSAHRQQWAQSVLKCQGQVILLLLTPSPARSLLNLPDPVVK